MSRASRRRSALLGAALLAGCGGGARDGGGVEAASTSTVVEAGAPVTEPDAAPDPRPTSTTEVPVASTIPVGLPVSLNVTPADVITITGSSTSTTTTTIRGVPLAEVVAWAAGEVEGAGWTLDGMAVVDDDGTVEVAFHGPGASGLLRVAPTEPENHVRVVIELAAP